MSDKQDKDALLVDQKDALGFYFDSLLLPDDKEPLQNKSDLQQQSDIEDLSVQETAAKSALQKKADVLTTADKLQAAKDFLRASKLRQDKQGTQANSPIQQSVESKAIYNTTKTITIGPVSPKPRPKEGNLNNKVMPSSSNIVFSKKNDAGQTSKQVLIPRSQRLAAAKKSNQAKSISSTIPQRYISQDKTSQLKKTSDLVTQSENKPDPHITAVNEKAVASEEPPETKESSMESVPLKKKNSSLKEKKTASQEAPSLDLSLFLPKIKTLSAEEISQQIGALTQAAVSQAQLESDLAHVAELEQVSQKIQKTQSESEGLIRNIEHAPAWAVPEFQVLLFTVAGLKLAVPLTELNGIVEWGDEYITELPGHKSWYLGIIQNQGKNVPVIDTLQQVVPKNRWPENYLKQRNFKHIIMIDNCHWGLACETVLEVITLKTDAVKWRSSRTKRRWLLGTVIEHMCALLDSAEFAAMLKTGGDSLLQSDR